jgi:hypothetical protein
MTAMTHQVEVKVKVSLCTKKAYERVKVLNDTILTSALNAK